MRRQMKKLKEQDQGQAQEVDQELLQQVTQAEAVKKQKAVFQNMMQYSSDEDQQESEQQTEQTQDDPIESTNTNNQQKQNKKNKKKKANKQKKEETVDKDIEYLDSLQLQQQQTQIQVQDESNEGPLAIQANKLNYNKEMSSHFKNAKLTGNSSNNKQKVKVAHKQYYLTHNDDIRITVPDKFNVKLTTLNDQGLQQFVFEASTTYQRRQIEYNTVKNTLDPQAIFNFLSLYPLHCDALFDVSEYFRIKGDYKQANELLERLLFIYEESLGYQFHKFFKQATPTMELEYNEYSKTFLMSLLKFTDVLQKKGCYKAALEFTKTLIKLCPTADPTGAFLLLDYHCLLTQQFDYLLYYTQTFTLEIYKSRRCSLVFMPNYLYNCALAKFSLETIENRQNQELNFTQQDFEAALTNFGQYPLQANHRVLILQAILLYPSVVLALANAGEFTKQNVANHDSFKENQRKPFKDLLQEDFLQRETYLYWFLQLESDEDAEGFKKCIEIFPEKCKVYWKAGEVVQWLKGALGLIINNIQSGVLDLGKFYEDLSIAPESQEIYNEIPFQFRRYKSLVKSHFQNNNERLDFNNLFAENIGAGQQQQQQQAPQNFNPLNANHGLLGAMFGTLLPWVHHPNAQ